MAVSKDEVLHIAKLAKLKFSDQELEGFTLQFNEILGYVEKLQELDTENVSPLSYPVGRVNVFRQDRVKASTSTEVALSNAPKRTELFFKVPRVINQG